MPTRTETARITTTGPAIDLKKQCLDDYFDNGLSQGELIRKYQRSRGTVQVWIAKARKEGRDRTVKPTQFGPKPIHKNEPLSSFHRRFGLHLYHWRMQLPDPTPAVAAELLGYSRTAFSKMESGQYDITLSEMINIAQTIGMELLDLLKLKKEKDPPCSLTSSTTLQPCN